MSASAIKATNAQPQVTQPKSKTEGALQKTPVEKIEPQATYKLKPIVARIIAAALLAFSFFTVVLGISLLASSTVTILGLGHTATRIIGAVAAILSCAGLLRGFSLLEDSFSKAKPQEAKENSPGGNPAKSDKAADGIVGMVANALDRMPGTYNLTGRNESQGQKERKLTLLPKSLFDKTDARILLVGDNLLTEIPTDIENLSELEHLDAIKNPITSLPDAIGNLPKLKQLSVSYNQLSGLPETIGRLSSLKDLRLSNNKLVSLPKGFTNLSNLTTLIAHTNNLQTIPENIGAMKKLVKLDFENNQLTTLPPSLVELENLEELIVCKNPLKELPKEIGKLTNLKHLDLSYTSIEKLPESIEQLKNLRSIYLSGTNFSDAIFKQLQTLAANRPEEDIGTAEKPLKRTIKLDIMVNKDQMDLLPAELKNNDNVEIFLTTPGKFLQNQNLSDLSPKEFIEKNIEILNLDKNKLKTLPDEISNLKKLTTLKLSNNKFESIPNSVLGLESLEKLFINGNPLSEGFPDFSRCTKLKKLVIDEQQQQKLPDSLQSHNKLEIEVFCVCCSLESSKCRKKVT